VNLNDALKYQQRDRLTVAQIHPSLRFTRLGAVLREHATAGDDVGALAHQALTSDHSQPLDLMPLHLLKDKMQEEPDHPLAKEFNWERVPEGVKQDEWLRQNGPKYGANWRHLVGSDPAGRLGVLHKQAQESGFDISPEDIKSGAKRLYQEWALTTPVEAHSNLAEHNLTRLLDPELQHLFPVKEQQYR
jgi:hypothetical protein